MYNISICEASESVRDSLEKLLCCYFTAKGIKVRIRCFSNPAQLCEYQECDDIVFLDVDSNSELSIFAARCLTEKNPNLFLYILSDKYVHLDYAMDLRAFRYLSKNLDIDRIITSLDIIDYLDISVNFMSNYTLMELKESEIACVFSKDRRTIVLTDSGIQYPTTLSIKNWLVKLSDSKNFMHPHYSFIVNKNYVNSFDGKAIVVRCKDGNTMKVYPSQRKMGEIKSLLNTNIKTAYHLRDFS